MDRYTIQHRYYEFKRIAQKHWGEILESSEKSWLETFSQVKNHSQRSEPTYVGAYLYYGLEYLNMDLAGSSFGKDLSKNGFQLKFGGIFVHQNPIVKLDPNHQSVKSLKKKKCEIGDLLVVFTFVDNNNTPLIERAFLSQAKINGEPVKDAQYVLYEEEDVGFRFFKPKEENINCNSCCIASQDSKSYPRKFPKEIPRSKGLKYLRIYPDREITGLECLNSDELYCCCESLFYCFPCCCYEYSFGCSIYGMMVGSDGWKFSPNPPSSSVCGWDHIIHDLLSDTAHRVSTLGGVKKRSKLQRGFYLDYLVSQFNRFDNIKEHFIGLDPLDPELPENEYPEEHVGINTLLIMVKDTEMEMESEVPEY